MEQKTQQYFKLSYGETLDFIAGQTRCFPVKEGVQEIVVEAAVIDTEPKRLISRVKDTTGEDAVVKELICKLCPEHAPFERIQDLHAHETKMHGGKRKRRGPMKKRRAS